VSTARQCPRCSQWHTVDRECDLTAALAALMSPPAHRLWEADQAEHAALHRFRGRRTSGP
jgi:hypothetical protein